MYNRLVCNMHVNIDPLVFGGGVTVMDSCHCNVPVVTLPYEQTVHKLGLGMIRTYFPHDDRFVASSKEMFIRKLISVAVDYKNQRYSGNEQQQYLCNNETYVNEVDNLTLNEWYDFIVRVIS